MIDPIDADGEFMANCKKIAEGIKGINDYINSKEDGIDGLNVVERAAYNMFIIQLKMMLKLHQARTGKLEEDGSDEESVDTSDFKWDDDHQFE